MKTLDPNRKRTVSKEVNLLKKFLKCAFPECIFSVHIKRPSSYVNSSDRLIVDVLEHAGVAKTQILETITKGTIGMQVGWHGDYLVAYRRYDPYMLNVDTGEFESVDAEFIELIL